MTKYKFNIDKPDPSDEKIDRHKDFGKLQANYNRMTKPLYKTPLYKNPKVFLVLLLILVLAYVIAEFTAEKKEHTTPPKKDSALLLPETSIKGKVFVTYCPAGIIDVAGKVTFTPVAVSS